jgi:hypothetical protein
MLTVYHSTMISFMIAISLFAVLSTTMTNMVYVTGFATVPLTTRTVTTTTTLEATPFLFGFLNKKDDNDDDDKSVVVTKNKKAPATTKKNTAAVKNKAKSKESSGSVKNTNTYNSRSK